MQKNYSLRLAVSCQKRTEAAVRKPGSVSLYSVTLCEHANMVMPYGTNRMNWKDGIMHSSSEVEPCFET